MGDVKCTKMGKTHGMTMKQTNSNLKFEIRTNEQIQIWHLKNEPRKFKCWKSLNQFGKWFWKLILIYVFQIDTTVFTLRRPTTTVFTLRRKTPTATGTRKRCGEKKEFHSVTIRILNILRFSRTVWNNVEASKIRCYDFRISVVVDEQITVLHWLSIETFEKNNWPSKRCVTVKPPTMFVLSSASTFSNNKINL